MKEYCYTHATTVGVSNDPNVFKLGVANHGMTLGYQMIQIMVLGFQRHRLGLELGLGLRHSLRCGFELYECLL